VVAGVCYNAALSFLNARGLYIGRAAVVVAELGVLACAGLLLLRSGFRRSDMPAGLLLFLFLVNALAVSLLSGALFIDMARNAAVIAIYLMIGMRINERSLKLTVAILSAAVFAILVLEMVSVQSYAFVLEPGRYFEQTRGISRFELDEIGLFANALGFDDRFSILNIVGHRTSSLFLEQVSLANFATVLTIFLVGMWRRIRWQARLAYILLITLILVTNNSRTALAISLIAPLVYLAAPKLPRFISVALMPLVLLTALIVTMNAPPSKEDDLVGRLSLTIRTLGDLDVMAMLGGRAPASANFVDSGYTFVIYAASILGLLLLWGFFCLVLNGPAAAQKRTNLAIGLYLFLNLTVSGTSVFSIKTAALLWLIVGFLRSETDTPVEDGLTPAKERQPRAVPLPAGRLQRG
jgi:hypothetical protein